MIYELWNTETNNIIAVYERLEDARAEIERAYRYQASDAKDLSVFALDQSTGRGHYLDLGEVRPSTLAS